MIELRDFTPSDTDALVRILNDDEVVRYLSTKIPSPYTAKDADWWINEGSKNGLIKAIACDRQLIGCIGVVPGEHEYHRSGEIGYWLDRAYWQRGLMSKAIVLITDEVFATTSMNRIFGTVFSDNLASQKLLEKCGFRPEAVLSQSIFKNGQFYDAHIFAKLKICPINQQTGSMT